MLVLNATYEPINVCTVRRATVLLLKEKAEVIEIGATDLHWATGSLPRPVVIRLVTYVRVPRDTPQAQDHPPRRVRPRRLECQYCGARTSLTVDHVIPRSKGGGSGWDNIVASCAPVQPPQGRPAAAPDQHAPADQAAHAGRAHLHPARVADDPGDLAAVPAAERPELAPSLADVACASGDRRP